MLAHAVFYDNMFYIYSSGIRGNLVETKQVARKRQTCHDGKVWVMKRRGRRWWNCFMRRKISSSWRYVLDFLCTVVHQVLQYLSLQICFMANPKCSTILLLRKIRISHKKCPPATLLSLHNNFVWNWICLCSAQAPPSSICCFFILCISHL